MCGGLLLQQKLYFVSVFPSCATGIIYLTFYLFRFSPYAMFVTFTETFVFFSTSAKSIFRR